jgi:hypothetical protein
VTDDPYRNSDTQSVDRRISQLEEKVLSMQARHIIAYFLSAVVALSTLGACVFGVEQCSDRQDEAAAIAGDRDRAVCTTLCGSMGLNGGVWMDWYRTGGDYTDARSCMCGNGMGGSVRVDPDGTETVIPHHDGPAR